MEIATIPHAAGDGPAKLTDIGHLDAAVVQALAGAADAAAESALLMVDVGRRFDDAEIVSVTADMCDCLRSPALIAPTARTEFAVLLPRGGRHAAIGVADSLLCAIHRHSGSRAGGWRSSASIGVACAGDVSPLTPAALRTAADKALFDAQSSGNDRLSIYDSQRHDEFE